MSGPPPPPPAALTMGNKFMSGIFDCFEPTEVCLEGWCCGYCQGGHQYSMLTTGRPEMNPIVSFGACCIDQFAKGLAMAFLTWHLRTTIMQRYNIVEPPLHTAFFSCCCAGCSMCQQHREMTMRGEWPGASFGLCMKEPALPVGPPPAKVPT